MGSSPFDFILGVMGLRIAVEIWSSISSWLEFPACDLNSRSDILIISLVSGLVDGRYIGLIVKQFIGLSDRLRGILYRSDFQVKIIRTATKKIMSQRNETS